jgi:hypothetical protein
MKMHLSWCQPIDMHCIVLPVKFEDGLSISVLRNKQLFTKKLGFRFSNFENFDQPFGFSKAA